MKPSPRIPRSVMMQSLEGISTLAAQAWHRLDTAMPEDQSQVLAELIQLQDEQTLAIDAFAELADQMELEIEALKHRKQKLLDIHDQEINRLSMLRERLDQTILDLNEEGLIGVESTGNSRNIIIRENAPSCEILNESEIPAEYLITKEAKIEIRPDKNKILKAWKTGTSVPGTSIHRKRRVIYPLAPTAKQMKNSIQQPPLLE